MQNQHVFKNGESKLEFVQIHPPGGVPVPVTFNPLERKQQEINSLTHCAHIHWKSKAELDRERTLLRKKSFAKLAKTKNMDRVAQQHLSTVLKNLRRHRCTTCVCFTCHRQASISECNPDFYPTNLQMLRAHYNDIYRNTITWKAFLEAMGFVQFQCQSCCEKVNM